MTWQEAYLHRFYNPDSGWMNGTVEFHAVCSARIPKGSRILEVGAGPTNPTTGFLSTLGPVYGVDLDPDVLGNTNLEEARVLELPAAKYPFEDGSFDACVSNYVLEHVEDPRAHFAEVRRVLVPGGVYLFRAPNRYHYVSVIAHVTPHWFHELVANRARGLPSGAHDPYPTFHRLNSRKDILKFAEASRFAVEELRMIEKEPSYGNASRIMFLIFMIYERIVNASEILAPLRANITCVLRAK